MTWLSTLAPVLRGRRPNLAQPDRHRPGYWRDYYARNIAKLRTYHRELKRWQAAGRRA